MNDSTTTAKDGAARAASAALKLQAVVDWIGLQVRTDFGMNWEGMRRALSRAMNLPTGAKVPYVEAHDEDQDGKATVFTIRLQDPRRGQDISKFIHDLAPKEGGKGSVHLLAVTEIEIALDAYCTTHDRQELAEQAARFYKFMTRPGSTNHRLYRDFKRCGKNIPASFDSLARQLYEGYQIGIGDKDAARYWHIYVKDHDNGADLPVAKHRARVEITLRGDALREALPSLSATDWEQTSFNKLTDYFRFRELKDDLPSSLHILGTLALQIGERKTRNKRGGGARLHSKATKADPMNDQIRYALRNLSARWKSTGKRGRPAGRLADFRGELTVQPLEKTENTASASNNYQCNNTVEKKTSPHHQEEQDTQDTMIQPAPAKPAWAATISSPGDRPALPPAFTPKELARFEAELEEMLAVFLVGEPKP